MPVTDKVVVISNIVEQYDHISSYGEAEELGIDYKTVLTLLTDLNKSGYTNNLILACNTGSLKEFYGTYF